jgi:hypothetical protein
VAAVVCLGGYYGPVDESASLAAAVAGEASQRRHRSSCCTANSTRSCPADSSRAFASAVGRASPSPVLYGELPSGQHTFDIFHSIRFEAVVDAIEAFTAWVRSRAQQP